MSAPTAEGTTSDSTEDSGKKRGGQRGERPWRDRPTARERVMTGSLAEYVKSETGKDVSPETVRAVRFCLPKWSNDEKTKQLRENMDAKLAKAKIQDKRQKALDMLKEAESELSKFDSSGDLDDDEDEEDSDESESSEYSDDSDDGDDVFGDDDTKVEADFS